MDWGNVEIKDWWSYSCSHQAQQEVIANQVQGPMPKTPLHSRLEGFREGREIEAIAATQYVLPEELAVLPRMQFRMKEDWRTRIIIWNISNEFPDRPYHRRYPKEECQRQTRSTIDGRIRGWRWYVVEVHEDRLCVDFICKGRLAYHGTMATGKCEAVTT